MIARQCYIDDDVDGVWVVGGEDERASMLSRSIGVERWHQAAVRGRRPKTPATATTTEWQWQRQQQLGRPLAPTQSVQSTAMRRAGKGLRAPRSPLSPSTTTVILLCLSCVSDAEQHCSIDKSCSPPPPMPGRAVMGVVWRSTPHCASCRVRKWDLVALDVLVSLPRAGRRAARAVLEER